MDQSLLEDNGHAPSKSSWRDDIGPVCNTVIGILGPALLTIPYALRSAGMLLGIALLLATALMSDYAIVFLIDASVLIPVGKMRTFEDVASSAGGKVAKFTLQLSLVVMLFGCMCGNMAAAAALAHVIATALGFPNLTYAQLLSGIVLCIMAPLAFVRKLDTLGKFSSPLGVFSYFVLCGVVIFEFLIDPNFDSQLQNLHPLARTDSSVLACVNIAVFAFTLSPYCFSIFFEEIAPGCDDPSVVPAQQVPTKRFRRVVHAGVALSFVLYMIVGVTGLLHFGTQTQSNIILNYPVTSPVTITMSILMAVSVCMSFPMNVYPLRVTVDRLVAGDKPVPSEARFITETITLVVSAFGTCLAVPDIGKIFDVTGATGCMLLSFLLPCIFIAVLEKRVRLVVGIVAAAGTISSAISLAMVLPELEQL